MSGILYHTRKNNIESIKTLINEGFDIHKIDANGNNALHIACQKMNFHAVKVLLESGSNPNSLNHNEFSPFLELIISFINHHNSKNVSLDKTCDDAKEIVELLVKHGANVNAKDNFYHYNAIMFILAYLKPKPANTNFTQKMINITKYLIDIGVDLNAKDFDGRNIVEILQEKININNIYIFTHRASKKQSIINEIKSRTLSNTHKMQIIEFLIKYKMISNSPCRLEIALNVADN